MVVTAASYQKIFTGANAPRCGKSKRVTEREGNMIGLLPSCLIPSTLVGAVNCSDMFTAPKICSAISPIAPQPKSKKPRQLKGAISGLYGRMLATPIHVSQSMVSGTGVSRGGSVLPCVHTGRLVQA